MTTRGESIISIWREYGGAAGEWGEVSRMLPRGGGKSQWELQ